MGNKPPSVSPEDVRNALDPTKNNVAAAFTQFGYDVKDKIVDTTMDFKDVSVNAGYTLKNTFTSEKAMDVWTSTANAGALVASSISGVSINTGFNNSSVPNYGRIEANKPVDTNTPPPSGVAPPPPVTQPVFMPDNQVFETSIYNPYNNPATETEAKKQLDVVVFAPLLIPVIGVLVLSALRR